MTFSGVEHSVDPRQQLLGAVVGVEDHPGAVVLRQAVDVVGSGQRAEHGRLERLDTDALAGVEGAAPVRELNDDRRVHCCRRFHRRVDRAGSDAVGRRKGESLRLRQRKDLLNLRPGDHSGCEIVSWVAHDDVRCFHGQATPRARRGTHDRSARRLRWRPVTDPPTTSAERLPDRDDYYLALAFTAARRANCRGRKVGAILVKGDRVIATGYNGTPDGLAELSRRRLPAVRRPIRSSCRAPTTTCASACTPSRTRC